MASWVAPGGWLVVSDCVRLHDETLPDSAYGKAMRKVLRAVQSEIGTDFGRACTYTGVLMQAGLVEVGVSVAAPPVEAGSAFGRFVELSARQIQQGAPGSGVSEGDIAALVEHFQDPQVRDVGFPMMTTVGRRPVM
jgi:hypothetical protein